MMAFMHTKAASFFALITLRVFLNMDTWTRTTNCPHGINKKRGEGGGRSKWKRRSRYLNIGVSQSIIMSVQRPFGPNLQPGLGVISCCCCLLLPALAPSAETLLRGAASASRIESTLGFDSSKAAHASAACSPVLVEFGDLKFCSRGWAFQLSLRRAARCAPRS
jgi:hypothetical protein